MVRWHFFFFFDFLSSSNTMQKRNVIFVAYISPQEQRNLAAYTHRFGCAHRCGPSFRVIHDYYFLVRVYVWGQEATSAERAVHITASSVLSHLPVSPLGVHCVSSVSLSSPTVLPPPPPSGPARQEVQPQRRGCSWASSVAPKARGRWWHLGQVRGFGPLYSMTTFLLYILV